MIRDSVSEGTAPPAGTSIPRLGRGSTVSAGDRDAGWFTRPLPGSSLGGPAGWIPRPAGTASVTAEELAELAAKVRGHQRDET